MFTQLGTPRSASMCMRLDASSPCAALMLAIVGHDATEVVARLTQTLDFAARRISRADAA